MAGISDGFGSPADQCGGLARGLGWLLFEKNGAKLQKSNGFSAHFRGKYAKKRAKYTENVLLGTLHPSVEAVREAAAGRGMWAGVAAGGAEGFPPEVRGETTSEIGETTSAEIFPSSAEIFPSSAEIFLSAAEIFLSAAEVRALYGQILPILLAGKNKTRKFAAISYQTIQELL
ncbi:MAG: hypothetical protein ACI353_05965 [Alloprevotella sp.]